MSLQSAGSCTIPNKSADSRSLDLCSNGTNYIGDISGAQPTQKMNRFTNKPNLYSINDIKGTRPLELHRGTNSVDYTLKLDDIEGAMPAGKSHLLARAYSKPVDPLMPVYKLPSYEVPKDVTPAFLRDTLDTSDISGTRAAPLYRYPARENYLVNDIEGAKAGWKPRHKRAGVEGTPRDIMAVADINQQGVKKSNRCSDPLRPVHFINGMLVQDDMKYTMPKRLPPQREGPFFPLTTSDIEGAYPGWTPPHSMQPPIEQRRHFRNTNFVGDIAGAQSDTVMHCIKTNRVTNPLNPDYTSLDGDSLDMDASKGAASVRRMQESTDGLEYAIQNSKRQEAEYRSARSAREQLSNTAEFRDIPAQRSSRRPSRQASPQVPQTDTMDARDARIYQLEQEVQELRSTTKMGRPPQQPMYDTQGFRAPSPGGATQYREPSPQPFYNNSRGASPALSARSNRSNGAGVDYGAVVLSARSNTGSSAERMILRSSDGATRVNMTPREIRSAKAYNDDVQSVRDL
jgi:hypothetical protein